MPSIKKYQILKEKTFKIGETKLKYFEFDDNEFYIRGHDIINYLNIPIITEPLDFEMASVIYINKSGHFDEAYNLKDVSTLLINLIEKSKNELVLNNVCVLASILITLGLEKLTGEKIISEQTKEDIVKFDDLLSGLLKVPPPKTKK